MKKINTNPLHSLYYHITNRCNLRCKHCWVEGGEEYLDELALNDAIDIVKQCVKLGLKSIKLTGGEPLVVPWLREFIKFLSTIEISTTIETNGTLITAELAEFFAENNVKFVAVSLDGANASSHEYIRCVPGCFDQTINGIKNLVNIGIRCQIMVAVHKGNLNELDDIGLLAAELGVKTIKLNCINDMGRGNDMVLNNETLDNNAQLDLLDSLEKIEQHSGVKFKLWIPPALKSITKLKCHCCSACDVIHCIGLLPNGDFSLCGVGITTPKLNFGNFREYNVAEIWNNNPIIEEINDGVPDKLEGVCAECVFRTTCRGACRARAYVHSGSLLGPDPICQQAKDNGKFLKSRLYPTEVR